MDINSLQTGKPLQTGKTAHWPAVPPQVSPPASSLDAPVGSPSGGSDELKKVFTEFVGQSLFGQMLSAMRKTVDKPAYLHGGQTEEIFQQQLDQHLVQEITTASADRFADPMFELFLLQRSQ